MTEVVWDALLVGAVLFTTLMLLFIATEVWKLVQQVIAHERQLANLRSDLEQLRNNYDRDKQDRNIGSKAT